MKSNVFELNWVSLASYAVGILAMLSIYLVLAGKRIPLIGNGKAAFVILFVIGLSMSILGGIRDYPDGKFTMPGLLMSFLMVLGFLAVLLLILLLIGVKIPFIPTYKEAFIAMSGIIMIKWTAVHLYKIYQLLS
jgi:hypothetical protein